MILASLNTLTHSLTYQNSKVLPIVCNRQKKSKNPKFVYPRIENKYRNIYNWKTADRIEEGFSLKRRAKRAENKSYRHHARSYHRFGDIRPFQFTSVRLMGKTVLIAFFQCLSRSLMNLFRFLII